MAASSSKPLARSLVAVVAAVAFGCAPPAGDGAESIPSPIRGGEPSDAHPEVGHLYDDDAVDCTATLIRPRIVLTAAHCIFQDRGGGAGSVGDINVAFEYWVSGVRDQRATSRYARKIDKGGLGHFEDDDFAVLLLKAEPAGITPATLASEAPASGARMTTYGFGTSDCGTWDWWTQGDLTTLGTKRRASYTWGGAVFATCPGDSGGPHFGDDGRLYAVTSGGAVTGNRFGRVAKSLDWIEARIAELLR